MQIHQTISIPEATNGISVTSSPLVVDWAGALMLFNGFDPEILQVTAHDTDMRVIAINRFSIPSPTSTNASSIAAQERRVLQDLLKMRLGLASMHGGHIKVKHPGRHRGRAHADKPSSTSAYPRSGRGLSWFEAGRRPANVMPGLETW